jgi:hypothetical protein
LATGYNQTGGRNTDKAQKIAPVEMGASKRVLWFWGHIQFPFLIDSLMQNATSCSL